MFITIFMSANLYDVFFSDYFYFMGKKSKEIEQTQSSISLGDNKKEDEDEKLKFKRIELIDFASLLLRDLVFNVIKYNSYRSENESLNEEAYKLLEIMGSNSNNSKVISEISSIFWLPNFYTNLEKGKFKI